MKPEEEIPCVTQIPLTYGDNHQVIEPETMVLIHQAIVRQFGGFTPLGKIEGGVWTDPDTNEEVQEDQLRIEVWVPKSRIPVFKELVRQIGRKTKQRQMFLIIPQARVNRINIRENGPVLPGF